MLWLTILNNETFLLVAETLFIVVGSMLLGILLSYLYTGDIKSKLADVTLALEEEKKQSAELRELVSQVSKARADLQDGIAELKSKAAEQSRAYYDQQVFLQHREEEYKSQKAIIDGLHATIDSYQHRINIIQEELEKVKSAEPRRPKAKASPQVRVNFEHVSKLLGRHVTDNDLTLITGIGPKTAELLQTNGIHTWEDLAASRVITLRSILAEAGGVYKAQDPTHWAKQAVMASHGEWRKLRVYQETLKKSE